MASMDAKPGRGTISQRRGELPDVKGPYPIWVSYFILAVLIIGYVIPEVWSWLDP